jgi:hypothetical protein
MMNKDKRTTTSQNVRGRCRLAGVVVVGVLVCVPAMAEEPLAKPLPGRPMLVAGNYDVATLGYGMTEFTVSGNARSFEPVGDLGEDGNWNVKPGPTARYNTRVLVVKPDDPGKFNGTVLVEWLNVTGGMDVPVEWVTTHREVLRAGYAYVAVSAQKAGVEALKKSDSARYGELVHPGDAYCYDIFTDVGRLLRAQQKSILLDALQPRAVLAGGESQSAFFLATYVNAADPIAKAYDGFLIHSRASAVSEPTGIAGTDMKWMQRPVKLRSTLRVPVLQLITETDLVHLVGMRGFYAARQPDTGRLRTWELAGAAHADNYLFRAGHVDVAGLPIEQLAAAWAPMTQGGTKPINNGPQQHYVTEAALDTLNKRVTARRLPPRAPRLELQAGDPPTLVRDANGIAVGGIRTPWVDVPTSRLSGSDPEAIRDMAGTVELFDKAKLAKLYPGGKAEYLKKFTAALDASIKRGFILPADREEILKLADASFSPGR